MKGVYRLLLYVTGLIVCLGSCVRESLDNTHFTGQEQDDAIIVDFLLDGVRNVNVRSVLSDGIDTKISNVYLAVYCKGVLITVQEAAYLDKIELKGVRYGEKYNLYAMANVDVMHNAVGDIFPYNEALLSDLKYSLADAYAEIDRLGIPMAASRSDVEFEKGGEPVVMNLVRLFAKLTLTFNFDELWKDCNDRGIYEEFDKCFMITDAKIRQAASVLSPFAETQNRRATSTDEISDEADHNDIDLYMTSDGSPGHQSYVFYVPENCQGKLLPDNKDNMCKTKEYISNLGGKDYSSLCTYLDVKCTLDGSVIDESVLPYAGDITYRYYLGGDNCADFSIVRNTAYNMSVDYSLDGMTLMGNWKVVHDNWSDCREISFGKAVYEVMQGKSVDVFLHFTDRLGETNSNAGSFQPGGMWNYAFPDDLQERGLTCNFVPNSLKNNPDSGSKDFCFEFFADKDCEIGKEYELYAWCSGYETEKSSGKYVTTRLRVVEASHGMEDYDWEDGFIPHYVSQYGFVHFDKKIVYAVSANPDICCAYRDTYSVTLDMLAPGQASVIVTFEDKTTEILEFEVLAPTLVIDKPNLTLNPDGTMIPLAYYYVDENGDELTHVEETLFGRYLALKTDDIPYIGHDNGNYYESDTCDEFYICRLYDDYGDCILFGDSVYTLSADAVNCPGVNAVDISVSVQDPYEYYRKYTLQSELNDYSLFQSASVCPYDDVRNYFSEQCSQKQIINTAIKAQAYSISYELVPSRKSPKNGVWNLKTEKRTGYIEATYKNVSPDSSHPVGPCRINAYVENEHSGERIAFDIGSVDVYLHTALGASCDIKSDINTICNECNIETFKFFMQYIAYTYYYGNWIDYPELTDGYCHPECGGNSISWAFAGYINYIDVYLAFLHSKFDAEKEFYTDQEKYGLMMARNSFTANGSYPENRNVAVKYDMPYVINGTAPLSVQGMKFRNTEHYGIVYRKVLYNNNNRLRHHDKLAAADIFNKCNVNRYTSASAASGGNAPEFEYFDIMGQYSNGVIDRTKAYYWAPASITERDSKGHGYYVIHFYEEINPTQCKADNGWCKESFRQIFNDDVGVYFISQSLVR